MRVLLKDVADIRISNVDKKSLDGEISVTLCNFTDVYYNWLITKENCEHFLRATAISSEIEKFQINTGDVAITKDSETRYDIGIPTYFESVTPDLVLGYHCALIKPNQQHLVGAYLNALLNTNYAQKYFACNATGSGQRYSLSLDCIQDFPIELPPIETQLRITNILGSIDKKIDLYKKQRALLDKFSSQIYEIILSTASKNIPLKQIASISTGKEDANFSNPNGTIPFFTCGQSILKCPQAAFYGKAVLIAGNGEFNVKHYEGQFNAYQRTYVLQPNDDNSYGTLFYACSNYIGSISKRSAGSIVKFITKSDIENVQIPISENSKLHNILNQNIKKLDQINNTVETLINHKNIILPLLMNGQVVVR